MGCFSPTIVRASYLFLVNQDPSLAPNSSSNLNNSSLLAQLLPSSRKPPPPHAHVIHRSNQVWSCPPPRDCDKTAPQLLSRHTTHILDGNVHSFHASDSGSFLSPLQLIWLPAISQFPLSFCPHYTVRSVGRCDYLYSPSHHCTRSVLGQVCPAVLSTCPEW